MVRDSAGIEIVESAEPLWQDGEGWRLSAEPVLDVGRTEGEQPYLLDQVMGVVRLDDGGIVVANMGDNTLRFFDARGGFLRGAGRDGSGPGEFRQVMSLQRAGTELYAGQWSEHPTQVYGLAGAYLRGIVPDGDLGLASSSVGVLDDGTQIYISWPQGRQIQPTGTWTEDLVMQRVSADGSDVDSLLARPAARFSLLQRRFGNPVVFGPTASLGVGGDRIHYGFRERYEIETYDADGTHPPADPSRLDTGSRHRR